MQSLTAQQLEAIEALSSGLSVTAAAVVTGIHRTTVHHWCRNIPEFRHTLEAAKQSRIDVVRDRMNSLADPSLTILQNIIEDESASPALRIRTALAIIKFVATAEKSSTPKDANTEMLFEAAYAAGLKAGRESAAESGPEPEPEDEIHHNSSLSSIQQPVAETPRNASCPCGSQLKYKRCCGKDAPSVLTRAA